MKREVQVPLYSRREREGNRKSRCSSILKGNGNSRCSSILKGTGSPGAPLFKRRTGRGTGSQGAPLF